jgi:hypothetical protein
MMFYLFLLLLFVFGVLEIFDQNKDKYILYVVSFIMFCVFSGLKYNVGTDYLGYKYYYENADNSVIMRDNGVEPGYTFLMLAFRFFSIGFIGYWFLLSVINFGFKYYIFKKYSPLLFASLLIYFVGLFMERDFDGIRQGVSIGICYLTIPFILNRRLLPFILVILLASTIHASSLIFLPAYYFSKINFSNKLIFTVTAILVLLVLLNVSFTNIIIESLPDSLVKMRVQSYMSNTDSQYVQKIGISIGLLFRIVVLCLFTYLNKLLAIDERLYKFLRNGFFIGISISLLFNDFDILSHRLSYIYRELQIFIVPILIASIPYKKWRLVSLIFVFLYSLALLYRILNAETLKDYYHYNNYLFAN